MKSFLATTAYRYRKDLDYDITGKSRGGEVIAIRSNSYQSSFLKTPKSNNFAEIFVTLIITTKNFVLSIVYIPPTVSLCYMNSISHIMDHLPNTKHI